MGLSLRGEISVTAMVLVIMTGILMPRPSLAARNIEVLKGQRTFSVPLVTIGKGTYIVLDRTIMELLEVKRSGSGGKRAKFQGGTLSLVLTEGKAIAALGNENVRLSSPPVRRGGYWAIPVDLFYVLVEKRFRERVSWEEGRARVRIASNPCSLVALRHCTYRDRTRVVAEWSQGFAYSWSCSPGQVTLSVNEGAIPAQMRSRVVSDGLVQAIELGSVQGASALVIRTSIPDPKVRVFALKDPPRLVADIYRNLDGGKVTHYSPSPQGMNISLAPPSLASQERKVRLVIDPGHGGEDPGAVGPSGLREKDVVLDIGLRLRDLAREKLGMEVVMTRTDDLFVPLRERAAIANRSKGDLFVSIHANASLHGRADGFETFFLSPEASDNEARESVIRENNSLQLEAVDRRQADLIRSILWDMVQTEYLEESSLLATLIQEKLNQVQKVADRGVKTAPFYVLMGAAMPAVPVEVAFTSHPEKHQRLEEAAYRQMISEALAQAISQFQGHLVKKLGLNGGKALGQVEKPS